jgi:hypothetical protein
MGQISSSSTLSASSSQPPEGKRKCGLQPQFEKRSSPRSSGEKVKLTTEKYVQLLIEARETDPACWPPGLEKAAAMLQRASAIEEQCQQKHGDFIPEKLSAAHSREYFEIQLALDELQDELHDRDELDESAVELVAQHAVNALNEAGNQASELEAPSMDVPAEELLLDESWPEMPPPTRPNNYA